MTTLTDAELFGETAAPDDLADLLVELGEHAPRFQVVDEPSAAWVVDKLIGYDERIARIKAQAKDMLAGLEKDKARFEARLASSTSRSANRSA